MAQTRLEQYVERARRRGGFSELKKLYNDIVSGKIRLRDPNPPKDFVEYLTRLDYSLWLWTTISLLTLTLFTVFFSNTIYLLKYLRYVLGSIVVLFLPGYVTIEVLYPREEDLSSLERLALSIGLSIAITPLIGLILNYMPWGIRLEPILTALTVYITSLALIGSYRRYRNTIR